MFAINSLSSLSVAGFAVLNAFATAAIVFAVGEGDLFQGTAGYYGYCLALIALSASFVAMMHVASILVMVIGVIALVALGLVVSDNLLFSVVAIACWFCFKCGIYVMILTMISGGLLGIFVDAMSLVGGSKSNIYESNL
jgi:hypothetical protein